MIFLAKRIVFIVSVVREIVVEAVDHREDDRHVADIEVAVNGDSERKYVQTEFAVLNQRLNTQSQKRQPQNRIDPHGVMLLDNAVSTHGIHDRNGNNGDLVFLERSFVEIEAHCCTAAARLEQKNGQQCFQHSVDGEQGYQIRKRAGNIVGINAHEFAAERAAERIQQASVAIDPRTKSFIKMKVTKDMLTIKVMNNI